jgi:hypothetical protein
MSYAKFILIFSLLLAALACNGSRSLNPRRLFIYTPHGQDMLRDFVARYKQVNPEVEVQFLDMADERRLSLLLHNPRLSACIRGWFLFDFSALFN